MNQCEVTVVLRSNLKLLLVRGVREAGSSFSGDVAEKEVCVCEDLEKEWSKQRKHLVQRPWGSNSNEATMIPPHSQWGRTENRLGQTGLYRAFSALRKSLFSLNAMGSHWRGLQGRNGMWLTVFSKVDLASEGRKRLDRWWVWGKLGPGQPSVP